MAGCISDLSCPRYHFQAYDVLSTPEKRKVYDLYGEEGLKNGAPPPGSEGMGGGFSRSGGGGGATFSQADADDIFRMFFGGGGGGGMGMGGGAGGMGGAGPSSFSFGRPQQQQQPGTFSFGDAFGQQGGMGGMGGFQGMGGGGGFQGMGGGGGFAQQQQQRRPQSKAKPETLKRELPVTLEELASGFTKRMKITRRVQDATTGTVTSEPNIVTIDGRPGWKAGTKITFDGAGDSMVGQAPQDVQFVIREKPHPRFKRDPTNANNLITNVHVSLADALCGTTVHVKSLDGARDLSVPCPRGVRPDTVRVIPNEGMPAKGEGFKGDLKVTFTVDFPSRELSDLEKAQVRALLG